MFSQSDKSKVLGAISSTKESLQEVRLKEEAASKRVVEARRESERFRWSRELATATSAREGYERTLGRFGNLIARASRNLFYFLLSGGLCAQTFSYKHAPKRATFRSILHRNGDGSTCTPIDTDTFGRDPQGGEQTRSLCTQFRGDLQSRQLSLETGRSGDSSPLGRVDIFEEGDEERKRTSVARAIKANAFIHSFPVHEKAALQRPA